MKSMLYSGCGASCWISSQLPNGALPPVMPTNATAAKTDARPAIPAILSASLRRSYAFPNYVLCPDGEEEDEDEEEKEDEENGFIKVRGGQFRDTRGSFPPDGLT